MTLIRHHSIYLWNVQLLNYFGINLQGGTTYATCRRNIALEQKEIIYGILKFTLYGLTLNHLIIMENIFFTLTQYKMKKDPSSQVSSPSSTKNIESEKYIAITTNKLLSFNKKMVHFFKQLRRNPIENRAISEKSVPE